jgi:glycerol-3-phosphate dehydrogenase (NAD(P)+)
VVGCTDLGVAEQVQRACHAGYFRPYTNHDVIGCELGGATKNVIALAVGIAVGLGFGDNARASLITRGLAEIARIGEALGADPLTFAGLAGLGDLVATCNSPLSRNRTFGENLGRGMTIDQVVAATKQTAEGVKSCRSILALAREHGIAVPICEHVAMVVHEGMTVQDLLGSLLSRDPKHEWDDDVW